MRGIDIGADETGDSIEAGLFVVAVFGTKPFTAWHLGEG